jgi:hypothetical protein
MNDAAAGIQITKGDNEFLFEDGGVCEVDLRVFGFNENTTREEFGPLALITHSFIATPMANNEDIFRKQMCESGSLNQASMLNIIINERDVLDKVLSVEADDAQRKCVHLSGKSLFMKQLTYKGEDFSDDWQTSGQFKPDPYKYVLVSDIEQIACNDN